MKIIAFALGGIERASSRLRSYYLFENSNEFGIEVCRPERFSEGLKGDIVHIQKILTYPSIFWILIFRLIGKKVVFDIDDQPSGLKSFIGFYISIMLSTIITVDTESRKKYWERLTFVKKIIVISDVADISSSDYTIKRRNILSEPMSFLWIGYSENFESIIDFVNHATNKKNIRLIVSVERSAIEIMKIRYPSLKFISWYDGIAFSDNIPAKFMILNHKLNRSTLLKSENKMVLAILAGFIPIVSKTPAYEELAKKLNADFLIYNDFNEAIENAAYISEMNLEDFYIRSEKYINENYSRSAVLKKFIDKVL